MICIKSSRVKQHAQRLFGSSRNLSVVFLFTLLAACSQSRSPVQDGLELTDLTPAELVFDSAHDRANEAQEFTLRNDDNAPLEIIEVDLAGADADSFKLEAVPVLPTVMNPQDSLTIRARFVPGAKVGALQAVLRIVSSQPEQDTVEVGLYGLNTHGQDGVQEPSLQAVVDTLGYAVDTGEGGLASSASAPLVGDEIPSPLFRKADSGPVTIKPVARYAHTEVLPFGYYTPASGQPVVREVATIAPDQNKILNPTVTTSSQDRFEPESETFGLYVAVKDAAQPFRYTQDSLNPEPTSHTMRVYPLKDRAGNPVANSYLVSFEEASDNGYQDAVFVIGNVTAVTAPPSSETTSDNEGWTSLFNGENLDGWYTYLPSTGKNEDPKGVFKVENGMLHILDIPVTGERQEFGYVAREETFKNYHLRFEYRWGSKRFRPRSTTKRDSGMLYHVVGPDKVWPRSIEFQIQEGDTGDFWLVGGTTTTTTVASTSTDLPEYQEGGASYTTKPGSFVRLANSKTYDSPTGWNTVEVIVKGDEAIHIVNGKVNNRGSNFRQPDPNDPHKSVPLNEGRILFQAEGAEVFYRNIEIKSLD